MSQRCVTISNSIGGASPWFPAAERNSVTESESPGVAGATFGGHRKADLVERNPAVALSAAVMEIRDQKGGVLPSQVPEGEQVRGFRARNATSLRRASPLGSPVRHRKTDLVERNVFLSRNAAVMEIRD